MSISLLLSPLSSLIFPPPGGRSHLQQSREHVRRLAGFGSRFSLPTMSLDGSPVPNHPRLSAPISSGVATPPSPFPAFISTRYDRVRYRYRQLLLAVYFEPMERGLYGWGPWRLRGAVFLPEVRMNR